MCQIDIIHMLLLFSDYKISPPPSEIMWVGVKDMRIHIVSDSYFLHLETYALNKGRFLLGSAEVYETAS